MICNFDMKGQAACVILLFNEQNEVLLQLRDEHAPTSPNMWGFFGGGVDNGETPLQAVKREAMEELQYELTNPQFCLARKMIHPVFDNEFMFIKEITAKEISTLSLQEGKGMKFFSLAEIMLLEMVEDKKAILPYIFQYKEKFYVQTKRD